MLFFHSMLYLIIFYSLHYELPLLSQELLLIFLPFLNKKLQFFNFTKFQQELILIPEISPILLPVIFPGIYLAESFLFKSSIIFLIDSVSLESESLSDAALSLESDHSE